MERKEKKAAKRKLGKAYRGVVDDAALDLLEMRDSRLGHVEERVLR